MPVAMVSITNMGMYLQQNLKIYSQLFLLFDNKLIHCNFTEYLKNDFLFCILQLAKTFTGMVYESTHY